MQKIGVIAVFDTANFMNGLNLYTQGLSQAIDMTLKTQRVFNALKLPKVSIQNIGTQNVGTQNLTTQINQTKQAFDNVGVAAEKSAQKLNLFKVVAVGIGSILGAHALEDFGRRLLNIGKIAFDSTARYERLGLSLAALVGRELMASGAAKSMAEALELGAPRAQELLKWITKLAIESPFDEQGIQEAFQTALAYGFTSQEAQRLTQAMVDMTSATGQTSATVDRVALALGQMRAKGKVTAGELKQLTEAGVNISVILDQMGVGLEDVATGTVRADQFIKTFAETMERDFGGAAKRQAGTLSGLMNSLGDLQKVVLRTTFGPMFQAFQPAIQSVVTGLQDAMPLFANLGQIIGNLTKFLIENAGAIMHIIAVAGAFVGAFFLVINAVNILTFAWTGLWTVIGIVAVAFGSLLTPIGLLTAVLVGLGLVVGTLAALWVGTLDDLSFASGSTLSNLADDMMTYGYNIIINFANGMAAAISAVIDVLIQLGHIITNWLAPGSPPKLLPELDTWGTQAMNVYLDGWTKADWSIFNDISNTIEGFLRSLGTDIIPEDKLIPGILSVRDALTAAINEYTKFGNIGQAAMTTIANAIGVGSKDLMQYIRLVVAVADAEKAVAAAQQNLNNITAKYAGLLKPINQELDRINKRRKEVSDAQRTEELQEILSDPDADPLAKELALLELREMELNNNKSAIEEQQKVEEDLAKQRLEDALNAKKMAEDQLAAQKALIDSQIETNKLMKEQIALLEKLAGAGGGIAKDGGPSAGGGGAGKIEPPDFEGLGAGGGIGGATDKIKGQFDKMIIDLYTKLAFFLKDILTPFEPVFDKLQELKSVWEDTFGTISGVWKKLNAIDWGAVWNGFLTDLNKSVQYFPDTIAAGWKRATQPISDWLNGAAKGIETWLNGMGTQLSADWKFFNDWVTNNIVDPFVQGFNDINNSLSGFLSGLLDSLGLGQISSEFEIFLLNSLITLGIWGVEITTWFNNMNSEFSKVFAGIWEIILKFYNDTNQTLINIGNSFLEWVNKLNTDVTVGWDSMWKTINTTANNIWNDIVTWLTNTNNSINEQWSNIGTNTETAWNGFWSSVTISATGIYNDVVTWFTNTGTEIETKWAEIWTNTDTQWTAIWASVTTAVTGVATDVGAQLLIAKTTFDTKLGEILAAVNTVFTANGTLPASIATGMLTVVNTVRTKMQETLNEITGKVSAMFKAGQDLVWGIINGIKDKTQGLKKIVQDLIQAAIDKINEMLGNPHSPAPVTIPLGISVVQGLEKGVKSSMNLLDNAVTKINSSLAGIESPQLDATIKEPLMKGFSPVFDNLGKKSFSSMAGVESKFLGPAIRGGFDTTPMPSKVFNGGSNTNSQVNLNMDNITISNGMDLENFAGYIKDVIVNAIDTPLGSGI